MARDFLLGGGQHGVAEIAAHCGSRGLSIERQQQVARATAEIQRSRVGTLQYVADSPHRLRAPHPIEIERQNVIGEIVPGRDAAEHGTHPARCFLLTGNARGRSAFHARAERMAERTAPSSTPETTVTSPMDRGSTK